MSDSPNQARALALAGAAQFTQYAHALASRGTTDAAHLAAAIAAILCTDPDSTAQVFNGSNGAADGIAYLERQVSSAPAAADDPYIARYLGQILRLGGRLQARSEALQSLRGAIERARLADSRNAPGILAEAYQQTVSPIPPRIILRGKPDYLRNAAVAAEIRTHLLAAVRCAILWRQNGGRFWRLILQRRRLQAAVADLKTGLARTD